jgi:hypothetical protein
MSARDARLRRLETLPGTSGKPNATAIARASARQSDRAMYLVCSRIVVSPNVDPDAREYIREHYLDKVAWVATDTQAAEDVRLLRAAGHDTSTSPKMLTFEEIEEEVNRIHRSATRVDR